MESYLSIMFGGKVQFFVMQVKTNINLHKLASQSKKVFQYLNY